MHSFTLESTRYMVPGDVHTIRVPTWQINRLLRDDLPYKDALDTTTVEMPAREGAVDILKARWVGGNNGTIGSVTVGW